MIAEGQSGPLARLLDAMDGVRASEGWLHLEVVGSPAAAGPESAAAVVDLLRDRGAQHLARGEVWDDGGDPGWRVTGLIAAKVLPSCHRQLFGLGAARVVGMPARFVFDRDAPFTFDRLATLLATERSLAGDQVR
jgi:ATP phosphoribosyltransferase